MLDNLVTLLFLVLLQAVLGFDNLLYISLESKRAPEAERARVRRIGITIAIVARIILLFVLTWLIDLVKEPFWTFEGEHFAASVKVSSLIILGGGVFIMYTAVKEIWHMMSIHPEHTAVGHDTSPKSAKSVIGMIVLMNLVFSFDSILSAMALTEVFWVMAVAIVISGVLMIWLADRVSEFLAKNRMYEVLGLFVLLVVGIMLLSEGGHDANLKLFGGEIHAMSKATFYFVIAVLVAIDLVQSRYQRKLMAEADAARKAAAGG